MKNAHLIAITGGIGSGKSVVSKMLTAMNYRVYDCDSRAKMLMDTSNEIKRQLRAEIADDVVMSNGEINRPLLAKYVFGDKQLLAKLNAIVHGAVAADLQEWYSNYACENKPLFVETAILYSSGFVRFVDRIWRVDAPTEIRIDRVIKRNCVSREAVEERIKAQAGEFANSDNTDIIINDGNTPVLPQLQKLLSQLTV